MSIETGAGDNVARREAVVIPPERQRMTFNFNFDFSMPIQDTFTFTRDPNRFPVIDFFSNASSILPQDPPCPNRLTTVNVDVQNHIMAFLSMRDLSALMRTCRYFLDACLLPLCARSMAFHIDLHLTRLPSFRQFLRINAGPSSRAHLIKELCIGAGGIHGDRYIYEPQFISIRKQWSAALLDILRHCPNVRRIRFHKWFLQDISFLLLVKTIGSSLHHLEDLTMPMPYNTDTAVLRRLARLPLRSLSFLKDPASEKSGDAYISLEALPRSLVELNIHRCSRTDTPFPMVRTLGVRETTSRTFVANATTIFPNVARLILRPYQMYFLHSRNPSLLEDTRAHNKTEWESRYREAWPSVSAIWANAPNFLYALGFSRRVPCISIPLGTLVHEEHVAQVLAETSPRFLELRVHMDNFSFKQDRELYFGPSVQCLTLLLHTRAVTDKASVRYTLECFVAVLPALTSLTHLLVRFAPTPQQPGSALDTDWSYSSSTETDIVHGTIQTYILMLADTGTSLRWIGYEVYGWGIKSWDISRAGSSSEEGAQRFEDLTMTEISESASLEVVRREGLNEFKDVEHTLVIL